MVNLICFFITAEFTLFSCLFYSPLIQNSRFISSDATKPTGIQKT
ncbi:hypothetical protein [Wolbachia endosymbiont (group B) of Ennomos erosarius]